MCYTYRDLSCRVNMECNAVLFVLTIVDCFYKGLYILDKTMYEQY